MTISNCPSISARVSSHRVFDRNARSPLRVKQRGVSALCQHLDQVLRFLAKALTQLLRRDHLSRRAPAEKPRRDLIQVAGTVDSQKLVIDSLLGNERPMLPFAHPPADLAAKANDHLDRCRLRARHCRTTAKSVGFHFEVLDPVQAKGALLLAIPAIRG